MSRHKSLCIPEATLDQHLVVLGKTGAGKSSALRHVVEHLLLKGKRVCVIDPKGDWWGLKASDDGKGPGFPVIAFGDFKEPKAQDVPINPQSGKHVAELITSGNRPCILGFRGWPTAHMVKFWLDFAPTIFAANSGELYVVIDECHNLAPKGKIQDPQAGLCLHWTNRLASEGRGLGIVLLLASQRPQKVHNDTLTSCETLVAMRVVHAADRQAVKDWIDGCGDRTQGAMVLESLANLARGEAYVWSPEAKFGPERIAFPMFKTFDSFAPPQLQKKVSQQGWADVDLGAVKEKMAKVIEEAKANDPAELKKQIATLKQQIKKVESAKPAPSAPVQKTNTAELRKLQRQLEVAMKFIIQISTQEFTGLPKEEIEKALNETLAKAVQALDGKMQKREQEFERLRKEATRVLGQLKAVMSEDVTLDLSVKHNQPFSIQPSKKAYTPPPRREIVENGNGLSRCARAILTTLVQHGQPMTRRRIALSSGYSMNSGGFSNALSELRGLGALVNVGSDLQHTEDAPKLLGEIDPLPTGEDLRKYWFGKLSKCAREILRYLCSIYPAPSSRQSVAEATGYSLDSGGFSNALSELRGLELIADGPDRSMTASEELFD